MKDPWVKYSICERGGKYSVKEKAEFLEKLIKHIKDDTSAAENTKAMLQEIIIDVLKFDSLLNGVNHITQTFYDIPTGGNESFISSPARNTVVIEAEVTSEFLKDLQINHLTIK